MADLDADLYGDLYSNDEGAPTEGTDVQPEPANDEVVAKKESTPVPTKFTPADDIAPTASMSRPVAAVPPPVYNSQVPQQIATYQESHTYDSRDPVSVRRDGPMNMGPVDRGVRPSEMKDEGKMFIGGLNWDTTDEGLKEYFEQFGKVDACTIMRDAAGRSRCFAFLTFEEPASVNAVMVREHHLDGKIIDPKRAIPRTEHQRAQKLFIGGLAATVTSDSMREFFTQYGKVVDSTVMLDRETGRSKGFGFISLEDADIDSILGFGKVQIDGKQVDIKLAQPRHQRDQNFTYREDAPDYKSAGEGSVGGGMGGAGAAGGTPFDPQALAQLYTRMFQMTSGGMGMMGGMGGMGMNPMGMGMNGMGNMGMGMNGMGGMGRGGPGMGGMGGNMGNMGGGMGRGGGNIPRGPRGGGGGMGGPGVGPQRSGQRGNNNYHPYSR